MQQTAIVIGAGIVGLATARALSLKGYSVKIFERNEMAIGASIRNFGMLWPIGQPEGHLYERAMRSREIWRELCKEADIWHHENGSLHLAYHADELQVMEEFAATAKHYRNCEMINASETLAKSEAVNPQGLKGALWSSSEIIIESRQAVAQVASYLAEKYSVEFFWNTAITRINYPTVFAGNKEWQADKIFVCSGADFETLYPEVFQSIPITKCKLQMIRLAAQPGKWRIGPSLCGGLTLTHYAAFKSAPSLDALKKRYAAEFPEYIQWGIHVMVSQNEEGTLTVGDTHEYGLAHDPFDREQLNFWVLDYLKTFARFKSWERIQSWNGQYAKMTNGATEFVHSPEDGVTIINATSGAGMTLSFGLAEEIVNELRVENGELRVL
jgi:FAD dependent oxidoreductase TIGR03364